ncbi:hypothetical protein CHS0354_016122 [Potamilus streckersoni]|uniref:A disintegrin and metalloproteinase with thrombospondin motifs 9 n=1 Tax=Potamilus streckersoni TaxID=2493646 RepID=A0AAE0T1F2_9BIVA|nr:hypothetical protein CHS0354_016122 [Potamilus streckersoni]
MRYACSWVGFLAFWWPLILTYSKPEHPENTHNIRESDVQGVYNEKYEIVHPIRVNRYGNGIAQTDGHYRRRRSVPKDSTTVQWDITQRVYYTFNAFGKTYNFNLGFNSEFFHSPGLIVQRYSNNQTWLEETTVDIKGCFYTGTVIGDAWSHVSLSLCDGMTGIFQVGGEKFLIEPHSEGASYSQSENDILPHIVHHINHHPIKNETQSYCGVEENYKHRRRKKEDTNIDELIHGSSSSIFIDSSSANSSIMPRSHHVHKRSVSAKNYVEVMVAADFQTSLYHGDNLQHYILTLMSIVNSIYRNHTIGNFIYVVVVRIVIFNSDEDGPQITSNAAQTLKNFCAWQHKVNDDDDLNSPYHYDTAVLLTRKDLCISPHKCQTLGLAELGTMCDPSRSCSIIEDNGLSSAYTIAHELGHVFDLPHDDDLKCQPLYQKSRNSDNHTHLMSPTLDQDVDPWSWSECSRRLITEFIDAGFAECLKDKPKMKRYRKRMKKIQRQMPGQLYKVKRQCELVYGPGHTVCPYMASCKTLWCANASDLGLGCTTLHMPMLDGTECGVAKWCQQGACVKRELPRVRHGGWGPWRSYGRCTRPCGGGIKKSIRSCNNPEPENGGRFCVGKRIKYRHCNTKPCTPGTPDFRLQQCAEYNSKRRQYGLPVESHWIPKYDGIQLKDACKLYCQSNASNIFYMLKSKVVDGTKCRPDGDDMCVDGKCRRAGCDNKLGSRMKRDRCGVCGGDNSSCKTVTGTYNSVRYGYNNVSWIPAGASNVDIRQYGHTNLKDDENYLVIVNTKGEYLLNGNFVVSMFQKKVPVAGGYLEYTGSDSVVERINSSAIIYEDIVVQVLTVGNLNPPDVRYSYTVSLGNNVHFIWHEDNEWSECDSLCNGKRSKKVKCVRNIDGVTVSNQRCENQPQPRTETERCNRHCVINWKVNTEECSVRCGTGTAKQRVFCIIQSQTNTSAIDNKYCIERVIEIGPQPQDHIPCQGQCLQTMWKYTDWTLCTATCDGGTQKRSAKCVDVRGNVLPNHECNMKELLQERTCNNHHCATWKPEDWTGCSVTCGRGYHHRKVMCVQGDNEVLDNLCSSLNKPTNKKECYIGPCPLWVAEDWGLCSASCGKGITTRHVQCQTVAGQRLDSSRCDAAEQPEDTKVCYLQDCPTTPHPTTIPPTTTLPPVEWTYGSWTQCAASCGQGIKQRYVKCIDAQGKVQDPSRCSHLEKPKETEVCTQRACGYWRSGEWSECSVTCSKGIQTRYVACVMIDGQDVDALICDMDIKPATRRTCDAGKCIPFEDFDIGRITSNTVINISHWRVGPWSGCSSTCGTGWQRRQVVCHDEKGPSSSCDTAQKPAEKQSCNAGHCPYWVYGDWTPCSVTCGENGVQKRVVKCHSGDGHPLPESNCDIFQRPPDSRMCNNGACSTNRSWQVGPWSPCSVTCGRGQCQREVLCVDESGNTHPSSDCLDKKPRNTKQCKMVSCPEWFAKPWSKCSASCGEGVRHRQVECQMGNKAVDDVLCGGKKKIKQEAKCQSKKCSEYMWKTGNWSECSKTCGFGSKIRTIVCEDVHGNEVNEEFCIADRKPKDKRRCSEFPCPFIWNTGPWSECSKTCGEGVHTRHVVCQAMTKEGWILPGEVPYGCKDHDKPNDTQPCNLGQCRAPYNWMSGPWGECSVRCGFGIERRMIVCIDYAGRRRSKKTCPQLYKPDSQRQCYNGPCYAKSCKQLREQTSIRQDGSYKLFVQGRLIEVYCRNMRKQVPQEFISLPPKGENFAEVYPHRLKRAGTCPNNGTRMDSCNEDYCRQMTYRNTGYTIYSKIKIDIISLKVITIDTTYAITTGKHIPYGSAGDCYSSSDCPQGRFSIDLSGTGLIVSKNTTWVVHGPHASQRVQRLQDDEIVKGVCGGLCGDCFPDVYTGLQLGVLVDSQ